MILVGTRRTDNCINIHTVLPSHQQLPRYHGAMRVTTCAAWVCAKDEKGKYTFCFRRPVSTATWVSSTSTASVPHSPSSRSTAASSPGEHVWNRCDINYQVTGINTLPFL